MKNEIDELNRLLTEERQRCDALSNDNDSICRLLEETRTQNLQTEQNLHKNFEEKLQENDQQIEQLNSQIVHFQEQLKSEVRINFIFSFFYSSSSSFQKNQRDQTIETLREENERLKNNTEVNDSSVIQLLH